MTLIDKIIGSEDNEKMLKELNVIYEWAKQKLTEFSEKIFEQIRQND